MGDFFAASFRIYLWSKFLEVEPYNRRVKGEAQSLARIHRASSSWLVFRAVSSAEGVGRRRLLAGEAEGVKPHGQMGIFRNFRQEISRKSLIRFSDFLENHLSLKDFAYSIDSTFVDYSVAYMVFMEMKRSRNSRRERDFSFPMVFIFMFEKKALPLSLNTTKMGNQTQAAAKAAKNDEFYTQYHDIEIEVNAYLEYDPDVFRGKTVLLPCDDPEWSNFTKFFAQKFEVLGLKKLISTSFAPDSKKYKYGYQPSLFEEQNPNFDISKTQTHGKIFVLERDNTGDGRIDYQDIEWQYLEGDGDFRSKEVCKLRDEADIIVTNPPFSLFREFLAWIVSAKKQFLIIGNMNAISYKEVFPLIRDNQMWMGNGFKGGNAYFRPIGQREYANGVYDESTGLVKFRNCCWFTNIDHGRRHEPLSLMTMAENLRFSKHKEIKGQKDYVHYENYDAIDVPYTDAIPSDYDGVMGVPITFIDKYCPEQFEIIGHPHGDYGLELGLKPYPRELKALNKGLRECDLYYMVDGKPELPYRRILIRKKQ